MNAPSVLRPLSWTLKTVIFLSLLPGSHAFAQILVNAPQTIDATGPLDSYRVVSTGNLTANGATTLQISTITGAKLTLTGSQVSAGTSSSAVSLTGADALIVGSVLTGGADGLGMAVIVLHDHGDESRDKCRLAQ